MFEIIGYANLQIIILMNVFNYVSFPYIFVELVYLFIANNIRDFIRIMISVLNSSL